VEVWNDLSTEDREKYDTKHFKYIDVEVSVDEYPDATVHTTRYQKITDKTNELPKNDKDAVKFTATMGKRSRRTRAVAVGRPPNRNREGLQN
jgi:hypothetical protein